MVAVILVKMNSMSNFSVIITTVGKRVKGNKAKGIDIRNPKSRFHLGFGVVK